MLRWVSVYVMHVHGVRVIVRLCVLMYEYHVGVSIKTLARFESVCALDDICQPHWKY